jgi:hypothetical protein
VFYCLFLPTCRLFFFLLCLPSNIAESTVRPNTSFDPSTDDPSLWLESNQLLDLSQSFAAVPPGTTRRSPTYRAALQALMHDASAAPMVQALAAALIELDSTPADASVPTRVSENGKVSAAGLLATRLLARARPPPVTCSDGNGHLQPSFDASPTPPSTPPAISPIAVSPRKSTIPTPENTRTRTASGVLPEATARSPPLTPSASKPPSDPFAAAASAFDTPAIVKVATATQTTPDQTAPPPPPPPPPPLPKEVPPVVAPKVDPTLTVVLTDEVHLPHIRSHPRPHHPHSEHNRLIGTIRDVVHRLCLVRAVSMSVVSVVCLISNAVLNSPSRYFAVPLCARHSHTIVSHVPPRKRPGASLAQPRPKRASPQLHCRLTRQSCRFPDCQMTGI